jgi:hypothetical protein
MWNVELTRSLGKTFDPRVEGSANQIEPNSRFLALAEASGLRSFAATSVTCNRECAWQAVNRSVKRNPDCTAFGQTAISSDHGFATAAYTL